MLGAEARAKQRRDKQVILNMHPPPLATHAKTSHAASNDPIENINQGPERANVSTESSWNNKARQQDDRGTRQRPYPLSRGDCRGQTDERIDRQKEVRRDKLLVGKFVGIV